MDGWQIEGEQSSFGHDGCGGREYAKHLVSTTDLLRESRGSCHSRHAFPHICCIIQASCKRFAAFLKRSPDTATADDIRRFQLHLAEPGISICNRNRIMTGVRFLFRVTLRRPAEIYHLKEPEKLPLTVSPNEAERLLTMASSLRDQVMLSLGYGCGLRAGEIVRLKDGDIDSARMIIRIVQSKGDKDRHVMLPPELLSSLRQWWKVRPTRFDAGVPVGERWLFPGRRQGQHLTYRELSRLFHESKAAAGITKRVSLHSLRHSFATELL